MAISLSLVALCPVTCSSQAAQAQGNPSHDVVQGFDLSGQIVCPDGQSFSAYMDFFAVEEPDKTLHNQFLVNWLKDSSKLQFCSRKEMTASSTMAN
jgi:hypothetical protein